MSYPGCSSCRSGSSQQPYPQPNYPPSQPLQQPYPQPPYPQQPYPQPPYPQQPYPHSEPLQPPYPQPPYPQPSYPQPSYPPSEPLQPPHPPSPYPQPPYPQPPSQPSCSSCSICPPKPCYPPILVGRGPTGPAGEVGPAGPRTTPLYICGTLAPVTVIPNGNVIIATSVFLVPSTWDQIRVNGSFSFRFSTVDFYTGGFYMSVNSISGNTFRPPYYYMNSFINQSDQQIASGTIADTFQTDSLTEGSTCMINLFFSDLTGSGLTITGGTFCFQIEPSTPIA